VSWIVIAQAAAAVLVIAVFVGALLAISLWSEIDEEDGP